MIVDDDPGMRESLSALMDAHGFKTSVFSSAEDWLERGMSVRADCMLLDVHLGGMSGLDLQRRLHDEGSTVPVIIITAFDDARAREQAERLGSVAYLRKPCEAETILAELRRLAPGER